MRTLKPETIEKLRKSTLARKFRQERWSTPEEFESMKKVSNVQRESRPANHDPRSVPKRCRTFMSDDTNTSLKS